jgi:predicted transcriptional regulator
MLEDTRRVVHRAIIDLHEIDDEECVTADLIADETGLEIEEVEHALDLLESDAVIERDECGIIIYADNLDYFPLVR